ncbi:MAG: hypothetical protein FWH04_01850 [Oscillospiraceae bacterium]|nr:hypothetical protein [Oscillospiraceae bacterium]
MTKLEFLAVLYGLKELYELEAYENMGRVIEKLIDEAESKKCHPSED